MRILKNISFIALGLVLGVALTAPMDKVSLASPGSESDPLVTLSYVDKRFEELDVYLDSKLEDTQTQSTSSESTALFEIVNVNSGGLIYLGDSTEVILRSGKALAITTENGGLADLTAGADIGHSETIPKNHHLLNPQNDGRGIAITENAWVMIKGPYSLVQN